MKVMRSMMFLLSACLVSGTCLADTAAADHAVVNPYSPAYGHPYRRGVLPTRDTLDKMRAWRAAQPASPSGPVQGPETLTFNGGKDGIGVTSGVPKVYLVFWGNQWGSTSRDGKGDLVFSNDPSNAAPYLQQFLEGIGTGGETWSGTVTQYCDGPTVAIGASSCPIGAPNVRYPTGGPLAGVWYDNSGPEPSTATAAQLGQEAINAAAHFGNTTAASNRYAQYVVVSSTGLHPDQFNTYSGSGGGCTGCPCGGHPCPAFKGGKAGDAGQSDFCAWHDWNGDPYVGVSSPYGDIAFTNLPYVTDVGSNCGENYVNAGAAGVDDGFSIVEGHEYAETLTDQDPIYGWVNEQRQGYFGEEVGDECAWITSGQGALADVLMGNGAYAMQSLWANDDNQCDMSHPIVLVTGLPQLSTIVDSVL